MTTPQNVLNVRKLTTYVPKARFLCAIESLMHRDALNLGVRLSTINAAILAFKTHPAGDFLCNILNYERFERNERAALVDYIFDSICTEREYNEIINY